MLSPKSSIFSPDRYAALFLLAPALLLSQDKQLNVGILTPNITYIVTKTLQYKSTDNGQSWQRIESLDEQKNQADRQIPARPSVLSTQRSFSLDVHSSPSCNIRMYDYSGKEYPVEYINRNSSVDVTVSEKTPPGLYYILMQDGSVIHKSSVYVQ